MTLTRYIVRHPAEWVDRDGRHWFPGEMTPVFDAVHDLYEHPADESIELTIETDDGGMPSVAAEREYLEPGKVAMVLAVYADELKREGRTE
jgi:hypothetical protein